MKILVVLSLIKRLIQEVIKFMRTSPGSSLSIGVMRFIARGSHPVGSIKVKGKGTLSPMPAELPSSGLTRPPPRRLLHRRWRRLEDSLLEPHAERKLQVSRETQASGGFHEIVVVGVKAHWSVDLPEV